MAQARAVSPVMQLTRPKLPTGLSGSPKGKAHFKGTTGKVFVA
jgi:hypothetical protein